MGTLTTHVLDIARGAPAAGIRIELFREGVAAPLARAIAKADGRTEASLLEGDAFLPGRYRIVFHVGDYFRSRGHADAGLFLEEVPVAFVIGDREARYHVPLLVSPWSYSTYRGS